MKERSAFSRQLTYEASFRLCGPQKENSGRANRQVGPKPRLLIINTA
jgi:hypothetical protein